jgi:hypothetical protein
LFKTSRISFGGTAAVVTSTALICGLSAVNTTKPIIISALLIAALADNLTDALSIHVFQESEQVSQHKVFSGTMTNFVARFLLSLSFMPIVGMLPAENTAKVAVIWGMSLLAILSFLVARERRVKPLPEVAKHLAAATAVIIASTLIPPWINALLY